MLARLFPPPLRRALAVLLLAGLGMAAPALADRALLIGIDAYERDPHITPLSGAVNDARAMRRFLIESGHYRPEEIRLLLDGAATRAGILSAIEEWLIRGTRPGERAFLFFAGHGYQVGSVVNPGDLDQVLISADTHLDSQGVLRDFVRDKELDALLRRLSDRTVTVVVDSCHAGLMTRSTTTLPVRAPRALWAAQQRLGTLPRAQVTRSAAGAPRAAEPLLESTPDRTVWAAVSPNQLAFEEGGSGLFTSLFIRGLSERAADLDGDGVVSHVELHSWILARSQEFCSAMPPGQCGLGLTPMLEVHRGLQATPVEVTLAGLDTPELAGLDALAEAALMPTAQAGLVPVAVPGSGGGTGTGAGGAAGGDGTGGLAGSGRVSIDISPGNRPRRGERVQFRIESDFDGYLIVFDITPDGRLVQLFPNRFSDRQGRGNTIRAGFPISIPDATYGFDFVVQPPFGAGRLVAVVTADPVDFSDIATQARNLEPVPVGADTDYILIIAERLRQVWTGDEVDRPVRYGLAQRRYVTGD